MIVRRKDGYYVVSESGKNLGGPYRTRRAAARRLKQVEYFKHRDAAMSSEWVNEFGIAMAMDGDGKWVTVGGRAEGDKKHKDGTPVKIGGDGVVKKGPPALKGKDLDGPSGGGQTPFQQHAARRKRKTGGTKSNRFQGGKTPFQRQTDGVQEEQQAQQAPTKSKDKPADIKEISRQFQEFAEGEGQDIIDIDEVDPYIGTDKAGFAALQAFFVGSYSEINTDPDSPAAKAMTDLVNKIPDSKAKGLVRVMAFESDRERKKFLSSLGKPGDVYTQDRTFASWNDESQGTAQGDDIVDQYGDYKVILQMKNPIGAKDITSLKGDDTGGEILTKKGDKHRIISRKIRGDSIVVTMESVPPNQSKPGNAAMSLLAGPAIDILRDCLHEAGGDVEAGFAAAEYIINNLAALNGALSTGSGKDRLHGGKADNRPDSDFDPKELARGILVELEHTDDFDIAREIAKDHLTEDKNYYKKLIKAGLSTDAQGHDHKGKGPGGGQFTGKDGVPEEAKSSKAADELLKEKGLADSWFVEDAEGQTNFMKDVRSMIDKGKATLRMVPLDSVDGAAGEKDKVSEYAEKLSDGAKFPVPSGVLMPGGRVWMADGNHRAQAWKKLGHTHVPMVVMEFGASLSVDATGHQHKGKGPGGGQFTRGGSGSSPTRTVDGTPATEHDDDRSHRRPPTADENPKIHSKEFLAWFGDWKNNPKRASKVVDKSGAPAETTPLPEHSEVVDDEGNPIVVFHGTPGKAFEVFDKGKLRDPEALVFGEGFYFAEDDKLAERFSRGMTGKAQGEIMRTYLNIRKPFRASKTYTPEEFERITGVHQGSGWWARFRRFMAGEDDRTQSGYSGEEVYQTLTSRYGGRKGANERLRKLGYDGVHTAELNGERTNVWVAFEPTQIKSVDSEGFDPSNPNINLATDDILFAHDIHNPAAQEILERTLKEVHGLSVAARDDLAAALAASNSGEAILAFVEDYRVQLAQLLTDTQLAALLEGARGVAVKAPTLEQVLLQGLPVAEQERIAAAIARPPEPLDVPAAPDSVHLHTIDAATRTLAERRVMTRSEFDALDAAARAKAFTVAGVQAQETLTKIRDSLAENIREGADHEAWKESILRDVDKGTFLSDAHMETVARTNIQTAFSDGQMAVLSHPLVRSGFPYSTYDAIHDDRVRENHLALETLGIQGTNIYRTDDPVFQTFRPPWDYSDRCGWTPITIRQAAERGIKEAIEWLRTGVEPAPKAHVEMPPFSPPPGFQRTLSAAPLSIQLSIQSIVGFVVDDRENVSLGTDHQGNFHGPISPGPEWVSIGAGPRGGKIWKRQAKQGFFGRLFGKKQEPEHEKPEDGLAPFRQPVPGQKARKAYQHTQESLEKFNNILFQSQLDQSDHLSDDHKTAFMEAGKAVTSKIPLPALKRLLKHVQGITFYTDTTKLTQYFATIMPDIADMQAKGHRVGGCFQPQRGRLHLDGVTENADGDMDIHQTYAHELTHAIDGPDYEYSDSKEWETAYYEDKISAGALSNYGSTQKSEGFAEFGRLVYGNDVDLGQVERKFPLATKFWKEKGLWPE